jgi:hypothetical protein
MALRIESPSRSKAGPYGFILRTAKLCQSKEIAAERAPAVIGLGISY